MTHCWSCATFYRGIFFFVAAVVCTVGCGICNMTAVNMLLSVNWYAFSQDKCFIQRFLSVSVLHGTFLHSEHGVLNAGIFEGSVSTCFRCMVEYLHTILLEIYQWVRKGKNSQNRLISGEVTNEIIVSPFLSGHGVYFDYLYSKIILRFCFHWDIVYISIGLLSLYWPK